ncbi:hypothetical protein JG688_00014746 [Phytophthora aleatoria]|uniref:Uncharacterized protein n=1 Tax=Phytophthora aleatoria TaxID=2496075 RepID=A0A8J5M344_9STRA|nr:hypothetical protein JG688_00014746 [Phytophthora aleatoria]
MGEVPNEKGVRAFSLFPVSTTYTSAHIKINGSTLAGIYSRIKELVKGYCWNLSGVSLSAKSFKENRWMVMRKAIDIARVSSLQDRVRETDGGREMQTRQSLLC